MLGPIYVFKNKYNQVYKFINKHIYIHYTDKSLQLLSFKE